MLRRLLLHAITIYKAEVFKEILWACSNIMGVLDFPAPIKGQDDVILPLNSTVVSD